MRRTRAAKPTRRKTPAPGRSRTRAVRGARPVEATPVTAAELRALKRGLERRMKASAGRRSGRGAPMRWNPEADDVQRSVAQLVLTIVEFLRKLMERQAIRRMEQKTLTARQVEDVGRALMELEKTIHRMAAQFGLAPEDLNLDLGPLGKLM